jgi:flagellar protein FlgJ
MIDPIGARSIMSSTSSSTPKSPDDALRKAAGQLEGMFVQQLFKAMRDTVPQQEGIVSGGAGEDIFTSMMDQHLAAETPKQWEGGMAEALYRQLRGKLPAAAPQASPSQTDSTSR